MPPVPALPLPPAELAGRLSRPLASRPDGLELAVDEVALAAQSGSERALLLQLKITASTGHDVRGETWQVAIPVDPADLDPDVELSSFVTTIRANIEEWWDLRDSEPAIAAWGHRVG